MAVSACSTSAKANLTAVLVSFALTEALHRDRALLVASGGALMKDEVSDLRVTGTGGNISRVAHDEHHEAPGNSCSYLTTDLVNPGQCRLMAHLLDTLM